MRWGKSPPRLLGSDRQAAEEARLGMIQTASVPEATAPTEHHADFLELSTLRSSKQSVSAQEFIRDLQIGNAAEAVADRRIGWMTMVMRKPRLLPKPPLMNSMNGGKFGAHAAHYPFEITDNTINLCPHGEESLYTFLALLSWFGKDAGPKGTDGEKIFEDVCAKATEVYLGGPSPRVKSVVFGFPRESFRRDSRPPSTPSALQSAKAGGTAKTGQSCRIRKTGNSTS